jgi:hypothetical protein
MFCVGSGTDRSGLVLSISPVVLALAEAIE